MENPRDGARGPTGMRCLAVCHTELVVRLLDAVLSPSYELDVLVESPALASRFDDASFGLSVGDAKRVDTYVRADLTPATCVIVEDNGRRSLRKVLQAIRAAGGTLIWVLGTTPEDAARADELKPSFPEVTSLTLAELDRPSAAARARALGRLASACSSISATWPTPIECSSCSTTIPIPMPSPAASRCAIILRRTRQTAIIGCLYGVTRPENLRMLKLLDLQVEVMTPAQVKSFDRIALVDVQPHYFPGLLPHVDLVIDHHPEQPGYNAVFKDIRPHYGSTSTILTEHMRAVDIDISERTATAMLYAIKSDTLFFNRQANRADLDAFSYLYPLADRHDDSQDGRLGNHGRAARFRHQSVAARPHGRARLLRVHRRAVARGFHSLRRRLLPAARERPVVGHLGRGQRHVRRVGAQSRLLAQRRRLRPPLVQRHRQRRRPPDDGQGRRAARRLPAKFGIYEGSRINQRMLELVLAFLHEYDKNQPKDAKDKEQVAR